MHRRLWRDGALVGWDEANVSILAHPLQRGSAIFDVVSFHAGEAGHAGERGVAVFRLREHVARFLRSAAIVGMEVPFDEGALCRATCDVVRDTGLREGLIRIVGLFPAIEPDVVPGSPVGSVAIAAYAKSDLPKKQPTPKSLRVRVPRDVRKAGPEVFPPTAKVAASYFGPMLARRRALAEGFDEIVLLDRDGAVAEAPTANAFAVFDGGLVTPPLGHVLDGITRDAVIAIAREEGLDVREEKLDADDFAKADEAFLTATSYAIAPVASIDGRALPGGAPGPVTARLRARVDAILEGRDPRSRDWLTPV